MAIFIHSKPTIAYNLQGIKIASGFSSNIALDKTTISQIEKPWSDCTPGLTSVNDYDSDLYRRMIATNKTYINANCKFMCYQKYLGRYLFFEK
jgi:hypothetical protein